MKLIEVTKPTALPEISKVDSKSESWERPQCGGYLNNPTFLADFSPDHAKGATSPRRHHETFRDSDAKPTNQTCSEIRTWAQFMKSNLVLEMPIETQKVQLIS
jgi:hypothetical protein